MGRQKDLFDDHNGEYDGGDEHDADVYDPTWREIAETWGDDYVFHLIGRIPTSRRPPRRPRRG